MSGEHRGDATGSSGYVSDQALASNSMSEPVYLPRQGASITIAPGSGCTGRVFKSSSKPSLIEADLLDSSLTYANLIAGTQPTSSLWMEWASGAVTDLANEGPIESAGDVAVIATATGGTAVLEVSR